MAQLERYSAGHEFHHHQTDENHPSLSSVPSPPGPELDLKHRLEDHQLPEPPVFSPPSTNTTFDDLSFRAEDLDSDSFSHPIPSATVTHEFSPNSPENISGFIVEPQTPEIVTPHLNFIPSVTNDFEHISQPIAEIDLRNKDVLPKTERIVKSVESSQVDSSDLVSLDEDLHSGLRVNQSQQASSVVDQPDSVDSPSSQEEQRQFENKALKEQLKPASTSPQLSPASAGQGVKSKSTGLGHQTQAIADAEGCFDLTKTEFQFALSLFIIPWSSLLIFSRVINQLWALVFDEQILKPISGLIPSILAPSFLYGSLLTLFLSSLAQSQLLQHK